MRSIREIASEIEADWAKVNYAARPYLDAMYSLESVSDKVLSDSAHTVITYFLSNASTWRGEKARAIKAELKEML